MSNDEGWLYVISNPEMSTLLKIGMTMRTPQERLAEANASDTWRPPVNYKIEFAKKVKNPLKKEKTIHKLLEQYNERVNRSREFFRISVEKARLYFDLMDGEYLEITEEDPTPCPKKQRGRKQKCIEKSDDEPSNPIIKKRELTPISRPPVISKSQYIPKIADKNDIIHANIRDLTYDESIKLITKAYDTNSLDIKLKGKYFTFEKLNTILLRDIKKTVFVAIISSPTEPDMYIQSENIEDVINKIQNKVDSTFILLSSICAL
jgi:hypothetical protein